VTSPQDPVKKSSLAALALGALGVVYGDIGTSPLYTVHEVFAGSGRVPLTPENVVGVVSVIFWSLMIVVSLKYVTLILRADNNGEGGIMALFALAVRAVANRPRTRHVLTIAGLFGAALFYGDGIITPAISVLSAVEGLEVAAPGLKPFVVPVTVAVLVVLFAFQRKGTAGIGALFGPVMLAWFLVLAVAGGLNIFKAPQVLAALNPFEGLEFLYHSGWVAFVGLGAIVLAVTGAEALYADMGHFGRRSIRVAWFSYVFPALALNYLGQGALIIASPADIDNPFYRLFPAWSLYPMVGLATAATVIASQAVITGTYSMTKQAILLGFLPRMRIVQTSAKEIGQIYLPVVNWLLLVAVVAAVLGFGSSTNLASAYGIAVTGTMLITTILTFFVVRYGWGYNWALCLLATGFFLLIDAAFFSANTLKILEGGWFPLVIGALVYVVMTTWRQGRRLLFEQLKKNEIPLKPFLATIAAEPIHRVPNTAVFLIGNPDGVPFAMLHNLAHNQVLHERVIFLTIVYHDVPYVSFDRCAEIEPLEHGFFRLKLNYGFMDKPDIPAALSVVCEKCGFEFNIMSTSFFLSRETLVPTAETAMSTWREQLFVTMSRLAGSAVEFFSIPTNRVIELGARIEM
jgi:KUP system potassium uptake protein